MGVTNLLEVKQKQGIRLSRQRMSAEGEKAVRDAVVEPCKALTISIPFGEWMVLCECRNFIGTKGKSV